MDKGNKKPIGKGKSKTHEVRFNLKSLADKNKATLISAVFRYDNQRLVYSTQHKIKPNQWNELKQRPKANYNLYHDLKDDLDKIEKSIIKIYSDNKDKILSIDEFKKILNIVLGRVKIEDETKTIDFVDYLQSHIESLNSGNDNKYRTSQKYRTLLLNLKRFRAGLIPFESVDMKFKNDFIKWRYAETKASSQNTINKDIECIKSILKQSYKDKLHTNDIFKDDDFSERRVKTSIFALNEGEVSRLSDYDFSDNQRLERVRDWFLISCWSALRWSDFSILRPEHIIEDGEDFYLNKFNEKTNKEVFVPIDKRLYQMLEKYNFKSIDISNQKFNAYIKEVFEIVGITDFINLRESIKGILKDTPYPKCDIVSAHDGRRTWASINYLKGYPIGLLMQVTGHEKEETFLSYVGVSALAKARRLNAEMKK